MAASTSECILCGLVSRPLEGIPYSAIVDAYLKVTQLFQRK